jgi:hypothetical protein
MSANHTRPPAVDLARARKLLSEIPGIAQQIYAAKWELETDFPEIDAGRRISAATEKLVAASVRLGAIVTEIELGVKDDGQ